MIFRLSSKLAAKLKVRVLRVLPLDRSAFADWSVHLFTAERTQFVIVTNTASLYSVVLHGRGISTAEHFSRQVLASIQDRMERDGLAPIYQGFVAPARDKVQFSKALNRSVTGSMNDLIFHAKHWLAEGGSTLHETAVRLNDIPFSSLNYRNPLEAFVALGEQVNN